MSRSVQQDNTRAQAREVERASLMGPRVHFGEGPPGPLILPDDSRAGLSMSGDGDAR